jgi:prolyl 4-hydroxylase
MNFLQSCGSLFSGALLFEDTDDSDEDDPWRTIQTHKGEVVLMRPRDAERIDPRRFAGVPGAHIVLVDPLIKVIPDLLRDEEISHLLALCSGRWKHSRVGVVNDDFKKGKESDVRTSSSCTLRRGETQVIREIEQRVSQLAGISSCYLENLAPVRYLPGQQYRPHHDGSARPVTIFIYLNDLDDNAGGETYFPMLDVKFVPRKGCGIMWLNPVDPRAGGSKENEDSRLLHAGLPPAKGVKYGLNCFFNCVEQEEASPHEKSRTEASAQLHTGKYQKPVQQKQIGQPVSWAAPPPRASPLSSKVGQTWKGAKGMPICTASSLGLTPARSGTWPGIVACN